METRHPVEGYLAVSFGCYVIITELWRPEGIRPGNFEQFLRVFLEKRPLTLKFSKFCTESFHCLTDRRCKFCEMLPTGNRRNRALFTGLKTNKQKFGCLSNLLLCRSRPKFVRASHQQCTHSAPDFIQIDSLSAEL